MEEQIQRVQEQLDKLKAGLTTEGKEELLAIAYELEHQAEYLTLMTREM